MTCSSLWPYIVGAMLSGSVLTVLLWLYAQRPSRLRSPNPTRMT